MVLYACRESTQVTIRLTTDASCGGDGFQQAAVAVAEKAKLSGREPSALTEACQDGIPESDIGTIVVVPSGDDDAPFAVRVVAGIGVPAEACEAPDYVLRGDDAEAGRGCIVARRNLAFLPHTELELPIVLRKACLNIDCDGNQTCVGGTCVSAKVDPEDCTRPGGCTESDLVGGSGGTGGAGGAGAAGGVGGAGGSGGFGGAGGGGTGGVGGASSPVTGITVGDQFSCALVAGIPYCWGTNDRGSWGVGTVTFGATGPTEVMTSVSRPVRELTAGSAHLCARTDANEVWCAGDNTYLQVDANAGGGPNATPNQILSLGSASHVAAGANHTCAALANQVKCWGSNTNGQVKVPVSSDGVGVMEQPISAVQIAGGVRHTCAVTTNDTVACWGGSMFFQTGQGGGPAFSPAEVELPPNTDLQALAVAAGDQHSCAIDLGNAVQCWGESTQDGLHFGDDDVRMDRLARPNGVTDAEVISIGDAATCVVKTAGTLHCWGLFAGPLGIVAPAGFPALAQPIDIQAPSPVVDVVVGLDHACYFDVAGDVYCWGNNDDGQVDGVGGGFAYPPRQVEPVPP